MNIQSWGIQKRAIFLVLAPTLVVAIALTAYFLVVRYADIEEAVQNRGRTLVGQLAPAAEYGTFSGNRVELMRLVNAAAREPGVMSIRILDSSGQLLAGAGTNVSIDRTVTSIASNRRNVEVFVADIDQPTLPFEDPFLSGTSRTERGDKPLGKVVLELSRAELEERKREILWVTLFVTTVALAAGLLLAHRMGRDITEPVLALEAAVAKVTSGSLDTRLLPHPSGTLLTLEQGFNEMASSLEANYRRSASALANSEAELARQLEIAKAKKVEAEHASEAKSRFLAAASHDLRQPLHALTLFATELASSVTGTRNRQLAAQIVTASGAMGELLNALLDVSRLDIAAVEPHRQAVALEPLLEMINDAHHQTALAKNVRLRHRPTSLWVDSDPQLLRRMIGNLVANAVRYTEKGGVLVGARKRGDWVRIDVWDTGIGIDDNQLPYLFHEFYQVGNPERDSAKGLGLGLSIVARLAGILDHPINVRSRPGRGSLFSISVPIAAPMLPSLADPGSALSFRSNVIVRMQDRERCGEICTLLDAWGYERHCACSDDELPALLAEEPAAVICDTQALTEIVPHLPPRGNIPKIVTLDTGALPANPPVAIDAHLSLPFRPARLRALLHHLLIEDDEQNSQG